MAGNRNNFLRWEGSETPLTVRLSGVYNLFNFYANQDSITVNPFLGISTGPTGIDTFSFSITSIIDALGASVALSQPCLFDGISALTIYRPVSSAVVSFIIEFIYSDVLGNIIQSGVCSVAVNMQSVNVGWVAYPISSVCNLDAFGQNNGQQSWTQLKLINIATGTDISPLILKDNLISDPNYVPSVTNLTTCPPPSGGVYASLVIANFSLNGANNILNFITITNITLACTTCGAGGTSILLNIPCNIPPGKTQSFRVPALSWDTGLTITYSVNPGGNMESGILEPIYWYSQVNGVKDNYPTGGTHQVLNAGTYGNTAINVQFPNGITIYCQ